METNKEIKMVTVTWKSKRIARMKVAQMKESLGGRYRTLVDNCTSIGKKGIVVFNTIGPESLTSINMLVGLVNGKTA